MSDLKKAALISPLLGATILTISALIYLLIFNFSFNEAEFGSILAGILKVIPILFVIFSIISYFISLPIGLILYKELIKNLRTEIFFINMSLFIGFSLSILLAIINYQLSHSLAKSFFIVIGISIMAIANANYFLILAKFITIKKGTNENSKGNKL